MQRQLHVRSKPKEVSASSAARWQFPKSVTAENANDEKLRLRAICAHRRFSTRRFPPAGSLMTLSVLACSCPCIQFACMQKMRSLMTWSVSPRRACATLIICPTSLGGNVRLCTASERGHVAPSRPMETDTQPSQRRAQSSSPSAPTRYAC